MSAIQKVVLIGATGNLGPSILTQLLAANFTVTVLTRTTTSHKFPASVTVVPVDYTSESDLTAALRGNDAVVSTVGSTALSSQLLLVKAAIAAGVQRFIPSEFGADTLNALNRQAPIFADKLAVQDALQAAAAAGKISYTLLSTGPFLDWGLQVGLLLDVKGKTAKIYDDGDKAFPATNLADIGKAVVGVLKRPEETKNRAVYVHSVVTTQYKLLALAKKVVGEDGWTEEAVPVPALLDAAWAELKGDKPDPDKFVVSFIIAAIWGEGRGFPVSQADNEVVGLKELTDDELLAVVRAQA